MSVDSRQVVVVTGISGNLGRALTKELHRTERIVGLDPREHRPGLWLSGALVTQPVTSTEIWSPRSPFPRPWRTPRKGRPSSRAEPSAGRPGSS
jgi:hypothetical protein